MTANPSSPIPPLGPTTGQAPPQQAGRFKPIDPLRVLRQYLVVLLVAAIVGGGLGVGTYFAWRELAPRYTSAVPLEADPGPNQIQQLEMDQFSEVRSDALTRYIQTQRQQLMQESLLEAAVQRNPVQETEFIQRIKAKAKARNRNWVRMARERLAESVIGAYMVTGTSRLRVTATTRYPDDAPRLVQAVVDVYMQQLEDSQSNQTTNVRAVYTRHREDANDRIQRLQRQQAEFRNEYNLSSMETMHSKAGIDYREAAERRAQLKAALSQAQANLNSLKRQQKEGDLTPSAEEVAAIERMPTMQKKIQVLSQLRERLEVQEREYGENHSVVERTRRRIQAKEAEKERLMKEMVRTRRRSQLQQARTRVESLRSQLGETQDNLQSASGRLTDLGNQLNRYKSLEQELEAARKRRQQAIETLNNITTRQRGGGMPMTVESSPSTPEMTSPEPITTVAGVTVLVLGLTTGLVFLREMLDQRMRSPADVSLIPDAETLGVLPDTDEDPSGRQPIERVVEQHPTGLMAESFRQLRTAVLSKMDRRGYKTLMVTGGQPQSGASSIAQNLATSLAHNGRAVLILDCNFRRPKQHELAGSPNDMGLVDVLREKAAIEEVAVMTAVNSAGVAVLPTGEAHDAQPELLESPAFRSVISHLEAAYDFVIIDAPPTLLTSEARMLTKHVDALMAVVRADREKRGMVERMLRQLDGQRADILGVVLNGVRTAAGGYFRKSYQDFYRYGSNGSNGRNGRKSRNGQKPVERGGRQSRQQSERT